MGDFVLYYKSLVTRRISVSNEEIFTNNNRTMIFNRRIINKELIKILTPGSIFDGVITSTNFNNLIFIEIVFIIEFLSFQHLYNLYV